MDKDNQDLPPEWSDSESAEPASGTNDLGTDGDLPAGELESKASKVKASEPEAEDSVSETTILKPGEALGGYRVIRCLCAGLIAQYYRVQHERDLHEATVGVFHHRIDEDPEFPSRLNDLQKTQGVFEHESFPKIRDIAEISGRLCMFYDPFDGRSLSKVLKEEGKPGETGVPLREGSQIIAQLLGALGYAHSQGLTHWDLDSDLIYLQPGGTIKILGLGVKAAIGKPLLESIVSASVSPLVSSRTVGRLNSFDVMTPEFRAGQAEDSRADIYSVGYIGYWLLVGKKADDADFMAPSEFIKGLSPHWNHFFESTLQRDVEKRFQSCKGALLGLQETETESVTAEASQIKRQIERIPVPKKIEERGELASRIYRLFLIGLVGVTLTGITASFVSMAYTSESERPRRVAELAPVPEEAHVQLNFNPPVVRLEFVGYDNRFFANDGKLALNVLPGKYKMRVTAPNHTEKTFRLTVDGEADGPMKLTMDLDEAITEVTISTEPAASLVVVDSRGAEIEVGVTNDEGVLALNKGVFVGDYKVLIKKKGFKPKELNASELESDLVEVTLEPLPATLTVTTVPEGASVIINNILLGVTPLVLGDVVPDDEYRVEARLDGYRWDDRFVQVTPGARLEVDFGELVPLSGSVSIEYEVEGIDVPSLSGFDTDIEVLVDNVSYRLGDPALDTVSVGERTIQLSHPLYQSSQETITVEDGQMQRLSFILEPRPGRLVIEIPPDLESTILIEGEPVDLVDGALELPAFETVEVEFQARDHLTMRRPFKLSPTQELLWNVEPIPIPGPSKGQKWLLPYYGIPFVWIPSGEYMMGSPLEEHARLPNEGPHTPVRFTEGFWAGTYEVTQAQYQQIMGKNPSSFKSGGYPVESVSWADARAFCERLNAIEGAAGRLPEGYIYRLPTEAEWEYAARAGTTTPFSFGDTADASIGHFRGVYPRTREDGLRAPDGYGTFTVGRYAPNAFGLYDVHGNVREWTEDRYNGRLSGDELVDPTPITVGKMVVVRGGGWEDLAPRVRSAAREEINPKTPSNDTGFRVFLVPDR